MEQLFGSIQAVVKNLEPNEKVSESVVFAAWKQAAGESLSARASAVEVRDRRLVVTVEDDTWRKSLEGLAPQLLAKMNSLLGPGALSFIEFHVGMKHGR